MFQKPNDRPELRERADAEAVPCFGDQVSAGCF
jgi:hypothetical protein